MIGSLHGTVMGSIRGQVIVDVGGVGYRVALTADTLITIAEGAEITLWTHLAVRENALDLYGFATKNALLWFELLLTVSGVGPKSALAILNAADTKTLQQAISRNDPKSLHGASGIGKKTAEKIVLELREKVGALNTAGTAIEGSDGDVVDALVGLGYSTKEARDAVHSIPPNIEKTEDRIREAIRIASRTM